MWPWAGVYFFFFFFSSFLSFLYEKNSAYDTRERTKSRWVSLSRVCVVDGRETRLQKTDKTRVVSLVLVSRYIIHPIRLSFFPSPLRVSRPSRNERGQEPRIAKLQTRRCATRDARRANLSGASSAFDNLEDFPRLFSLLRNLTVCRATERKSAIFIVWVKLKTGDIAPFLRIVRPNYVIHERHRSSLAALRARVRRFRLEVDVVHERASKREREER